MGKKKNFTPELWYEREDQIFTVGLREDVALELEDITHVALPEVGQSVDSEEPVGYLETSDGEIELYSPVTGTILEINPLIKKNPSLLLEDPFENWIFKVESDDVDEDWDDYPDEEYADEDSEDYESEDDWYDDEDEDEPEEDEDNWRRPRR